MDFIVLGLSLLLSVTGCFTAKIVFVTQFGRSHYIVMEKLANELKDRGHEVSLLVGEDASYATGKPNVKIFKVPEERKKNIHKMQTMSKPKTALQVIKGLFYKQRSYCDLFLSSDVMMDEIKTADIVIGDSLYPCSSLVADKFDLPHVVIAMSSLETPTLMVFGLPLYPAYTPQITSSLPRDMGFIDRIINLGVYLRHVYLVERYIYPLYGELKEKYKIKPEKSIQESLATVDMILLTMSFVMDHAQPIPPYVREVGNFVASPEKPLPAELEEFYETSGDHGVIFVSFGSMVDTLRNEVVETMNEAFSKMPQKVLWRINLDKFEGQIAPNIKIVQWVPQNDILGHNKTRLFFTHGGANGMAEASYHGVPMLCSPFFGDQHDNAQYIKDSGIGERVTLASVTSEQLTNLLQKIILDKRYKEQAVKVSRILKLNPRSPLQEAAELIEYVYAVGDMKHLKPRALELPFYQLYMLDVFLVLGMGFAIVLGILVMLVGLLIKICSRTVGKAKTS